MRPDPNSPSARPLKKPRPVIKTEPRATATPKSKPVPEALTEPEVKAEPVPVSKTETKPPPPKAYAKADVPSKPPPLNKEKLLQNSSRVEFHENYSEDEKALNAFLKLHPMLSQEATSQATLQLVSSMIEKKNLVASELPVVPKSHDDLFLRPANEAIGERPCINGATCVARFIAQLRYGPNTKYAFTCTEFLLPDVHKQFLNGKGLSQRRGKCLLCTRYFTNYLYVLARTDPAFRIEDTPLALQIFCNACAPVDPNDREETEATVSDKELKEELRSSALCTPTHTSSVGNRDGYLPSAMLFVDENFVNSRAARESKLGDLMWRPVVRFSSSHYKYIVDDDGSPRIVQIGVSSQPLTENSHFCQPPTHRRVSAAAKSDQSATSIEDQRFR